MSIIRFKEAEPMKKPIKSNPQDWVSVAPSLDRL